MKVLVDLTEEEVEMLAFKVVEYVGVSEDSVCNQESADEWAADMAIAKSISEKVIEATGVQRKVPAWS